MNILQLLSGTGFIVVNKAVAHKFGLYPAIMLGDLASKHLYYEENGTLTEDGYFFATVDDTEKSTTLSKHKQEEALKVLIDEGFVEMKLIGVPPKRHFKLDEMLIASQFVKNSPINSRSQNVSISEKLDTNNNRIDIVNIDRDNIIKGVLFEDDENDSSLFPGLELTKETEFKNSLVYSESVFIKQMQKQEAMGIDVMYYHNLVDEWCEKLRAKDKRKKRTARGWVATVRQFMRSDNEKGKLKMTGEQKKKLDQEAIDFLKIGSNATR